MKAYREANKEKAKKYGQEYRQGDKYKAYEEERNERRRL